MILSYNLFGKKSIYIYIEGYITNIIKFLKKISFKHHLLLDMIDFNIKQNYFCKICYLRNL